MALNELFGRFNGGGIVRVMVREFGYNGVEMPVDTDGRDNLAWSSSLESGGSAKLSVTDRSRRGAVMDAVDSPYIRESTLETLILRADETM